MSLPSQNSPSNQETDLPFDSCGPVMGEVVDDPFAAVVGGIPERHGNMVFLPPIELHHGDYLRVEARICLIHRHDSDEYHHARLEIMYFKRPRKTASFALVRKAALDGQALEALVVGLLQVPKFQTMSASEAARTLLLPAGEAAMALSADEARSLTSQVASLLETPLGVEVIGSGRLDINVLGNIEAAAQHARFKKAAAELREMMADAARSEHDYQVWFEDHPWVFGTEYVRRIPARTIDLHSQADILLVSVDGFVDIFELKKPTETALHRDLSHDTYYPSAELSKTLAQVMHYLRVINENRLALIEDWGEPVFRPRAIVVIGRSDEWCNAQKQGWRNLRTSLQNIDLLTFDHVLARAERLITQYE